VYRTGSSEGENQDIFSRILSSPTILFSIFLVVVYVLISLIAQDFVNPVYSAPYVVQVSLVQCNPCILLEPGWPWTPWTLVTSIFLHAGPLHLASNIFFLLIFGYVLEEQLNDRVKWIKIFFLTGIAGNLSFLAAYALFGPNAGVFGVGASGAVYGILGAAAGLKIALLLILVAGLDIFAGGGLFAHIGGMIAGIIIRRLWITGAEENACLD
jgi:membrane associated rhomboid family serine protease